MMTNFITDLSFFYLDTDIDSLIYYEIAGLENIDQDENDDSLNDVRRVRFSHAPIRVSE